jgi:hypothetical protein
MPGAMTRCVWSRAAILSGKEQGSQMIVRPLAVLTVTDSVALSKRQNQIDGS